MPVSHTRMNRLAVAPQNLLANRSIPAPVLPVVDVLLP